MRVPLALLLLVCSLAVSASAQTPYLVKDINTLRSSDPKSSAPPEFAALGNTIFFAASLDAAGSELWSTDGTSAGTKMVADINPGASGSNPHGFTVVNGALLFFATEAGHGNELWSSDGTAAGTKLVFDIHPGFVSSPLMNPFLYKNQILFSAEDGIHGFELWISDGTAAGTRMLKDLNPGPGASFPNYFTELGGSVYFFAGFNAFWKTDGTEAGTVKLADVDGLGPVAAGSKLFFQGFTNDRGAEPWVSDGTAAGTHIIADIIPGPTGSGATTFRTRFAALDSNHALFVANDNVHGNELWITDGTAAGTRMVKDVTPGAKGTWSTSPLFTSFNGRVYFSASDSEHGLELWVTDGTEGGTQLFLDSVPGAASGSPSALTVSGGKLFFAAGSDTEPAIWVSDGTAAGTRRLHASEGLAGGLSSDKTVLPLWPAGGKVYFDGFTPLTGGEPWVSDGTEAGTRMIANLAADGVPSSSPFMLTPAGNVLLFYATEGIVAGEKSLWRTDGTGAGTFKLRDSGQQPPALFAAGPVALWNEPLEKMSMSDGTSVQLADSFLSRFGVTKDNSFFLFGDTLFSVIDGALWKTTAALNAPAVNLGGGTGGRGFIDAGGGRWMYLGHDPRSPFLSGLWTTDGTPAGTHAVIPELGDGGAVPTALAKAEGTVFFTRTLPIFPSGSEPTKLWKSDGTFDGTTVVAELPGEATSIAAAGRRAFFIVKNSLWTSDGTAAGTVALTGVKVSPNASITLVPAGNRVVFETESDTPNGRELWDSDGTPEGTKLLMKIPAIVAPPVAIDGIAYFEGFDDAHGYELWTTDGTAEGTKLLADINPGSASSHPGSFTKAGNTVYFAATTDVTGTELWALPLTERTLSIGGARVAEGGSGTATLRFTVTLSSAAAQSVTVDYATSDGTARAGEDYDAASGTLAFAPGETAKTIDVHVHGDTAVEGNETFFVTLRNVSGARAVRSEAAGIIDDDDAAADVSIVTLFNGNNPSSVTDEIIVKDNGPSAATSIVVKITSAPAGPACTTCFIPQLASGQSLETLVASGSTYLSAIVTAHERDPQTANNATSWIFNDGHRMVMTPAFLVTGGTGTVTAVFGAQNLTATSSDSSVVSVGAVTKLPDNLGTFKVTGLKPGTATINAGIGQMTITVVAPGTTPRFPGGMTMTVDEGNHFFDLPLYVRITPTGTAPLTGITATGTVTAAFDGQELASGNVSGGTIVLPVYPRAVGLVPYQLDYAGDTNFLPQTVTGKISVLKGHATLKATLEAVPGAAGTFTLFVQATGSPLTPPGGTLSVLNGTTEIAKVTLAAAGGVALASATLTNLPAAPTLTINYPGDALYQSASQQVRVVVPRGRTVRH
ncbi:MAG TPA: ELWxxDGT repeat protein [Thermoanaerobaculia bacterium]